MNLIERINFLTKEKGISQRQLENGSGLSYGSISKWKNGFTPNQKSLQKISEFFGVSVAYLTGESDFRTEEEAMVHGWMEKYDQEALSDESRRFEAGARIPVLGKVIAGIPIEAIEEVIDWEEIPFRMSKTGAFYGLQIKGDSMSPRMVEGDVVIVRQQSDAESGDVVIVLVNGDEATCKKLIKRTDGIVLQSLNPLYEPMIFSNEDIQNKPVKIIGKVVELRCKL